jgi:DNA sulfur modification protein DndD
MLQIDSIELENFGPYKGNQTIDLPLEDGVTVVFGENMRGKTMLLNSIRYALFGRILSRGSREIPLQQMINWESREEGNDSFKVALNFVNENDEFELVRLYKPKDSVTQPREDSDFTEQVYLRKNGSVLGPEERERELNRIMPEQVSRFFLFDGELLQQYEELLVDESDMGRRIREAIERILGLPVLTNGRADLQELLEDAQKQESAAAQRNNKTQELGNQLERLTENRTHHQNELEELEEELDELKEEKSSIQEKRKRQEAIRGLVEDKEELEKEIESIEEEIGQKEDKLREIMSESWKGILQKTVKEKLSELRKEQTKLRTIYSDKRAAEKLAERLGDSLDEGSNCPICSQHLDSDAEQHIEDEISRLQDIDDSPDNVDEKLQDVSRSVGILEELEAPDPKDRIEDVVSSIDQLKAERAEKRDKISDIDEKLDSSEEEEVNRLQREYDEVVGKIQFKEDAVSETEEEIEEVNASIKKLQKQLDQASGHEFEKERRRRDLFDDLYELFDDAVDEYRDTLRDQVEDDATRIFLDLTTEPEYSGLKINDNYGLTIQHEEGSEIPVRSAGAEHVVALSLMGALQNNAPLQGPIIMDSPFGRLDEDHVSNVVKALPSITDQVVLLVYKSELEPEVARDLLKGKLRSEYSLSRKSARHTKLKPGGEDNE